MNNTVAQGLRPLRLSSMRGLMEKQCAGQHEIYVAEVLYVPAEGKLVVATVCRACDTVRFHQQQVAEPHHDGILLKQGKQI